MPGKIINSATSSAPLMIGEFIDSGGDRYAMIVNLNLRDSEKVAVHSSAKSISRISPVDASEIPLDENNSVWLAAGQGVLLKLR
jgi:hypothetical protein